MARDLSWSISGNFSGFYREYRYFRYFRFSDLPGEFGSTDRIALAHSLNFLKEPPQSNIQSFS